LVLFQPRLKIVRLDVPIFLFRYDLAEAGGQNNMNLLSGYRRW